MIVEQETKTKILYACMEMSMKFVNLYNWDVLTNK